METTASSPSDTVFTVRLSVSPLLSRFARIELVCIDVVWCEFPEGIEDRVCVDEHETECSQGDGRRYDIINIDDDDDDDDRTD